MNEYVGSNRLLMLGLNRLKTTDSKQHFVLTNNKNQVLIEIILDKDGFLLSGKNFEEKIRNQNIKQQERKNKYKASKGLYYVL